MIQLSNIEKVYQSRDKSYSALKAVSVSIGQGEFVIITGRSGSGKSTLLNILTGIDRPTSGEIIINHVNITGYDERKMAEWRGEHVGIVFQFFQLIPNLSVLENILLPMDLVNTVPASERVQDAMSLLEKVGLRDHADKMPGALSGGEQQRVAIARALANHAPLLVADEPTGNLDSQNAEIILELFGNLTREGKTILMVTHERERIPGATRQVILKDGRVIEDISFHKEEKGHVQTV